MDSLITSAARALAAGDPLGALRRVALREDAAALALRGIAMAQLGDLERARALVQQAARAFGPREVVARARCLVAEAEIALALRDFRWPEKSLEAARAPLQAHGDRANAAQARYIAVRRLLLAGRLDEAEEGLAELGREALPPALRAVHQLMVSGIAIRRVQTGTAEEALAAAERAARQAGIPALLAEVESAWRILRTPAARLLTGGGERALLLREVEALYASGAVVVDSCRYVVRQGGTAVRLANRPVLFALAQALGAGWPGDVSRDVLLAKAFGARLVDESHRVRLRVEIGRLRRALGSLAAIQATARGFRLAPPGSTEVVVLAQPVEEEYAGVLACLADGEAWSSSALAVALGTSQRTVQRALEVLAQAGRVQSFGRARARRWLTPPVPGFTTTLLLPAPLPID